MGCGPLGGLLAEQGGNRLRGPALLGLPRLVGRTGRGARAGLVRLVEIHARGVARGLRRARRVVARRALLLAIARASAMRPRLVTAAPGLAATALGIAALAFALRTRRPGGRTVWFRGLAGTASLEPIDVPYFDLLVDEA